MPLVVGHETDARSRIDLHEVVQKYYVYVAWFVFEYDDEH